MLELVTSVPDLQSARMLAAANIPLICLSPEVNNAAEIKSWIEGSQIGIELKDAESIIQPVDFLIIPYRWKDQFSFLDKNKVWLQDDGSYVDEQGNILFYYWAWENENIPTYLDYVKDVDTIESIL